MNLGQALTRAREIFLDNSIEENALESEILMRHALNINRTQLYMDLERELNPVHHELFHQLIERRLKGEPSAYITGHREFYGLDFYVDRRVLIPRPESELLVERAVSLVQDRPISTIAEVGTGCGAIAISLAKNLPGARVYATDLSSQALEVARCNCRRHGVTDRICLLEGNMLEPLKWPVDLVVANLPYVMEDELSNSGSLSFEPALALNGGPDGLTKIKNLCHQVGRRLHPGGCLLMEIGWGQGEAVVTLLRRLFPGDRIEVYPDISGIERVVGLYLTLGRF
ncbi:MAG: protein-(glutamine-N5) methyltransferase, release factor-specific [Chloroflexi bacterium RBG_16_50_9]|nr:MAG: protein-(glutamine-N5) methyltransferase, release factor-specific [Chloroflexi bacterium RBG_16_50_9]